MRDITKEDGHTCYNQCGQCSECQHRIGSLQTRRKAVPRKCCVSDNPKATFYHKRIDFNYDTSRCPGFIDSPDNIKFKGAIAQGLDDVKKGKVSPIDLKDL